MLTGGALLTWAAWSSARAEAQKELQGYFEIRVRDAQIRIEQRMKAYEQVLRDTQAMVSTFPVDRGAFRQLVASMGLGQNFPGIQGLGLAQVVPGQALARHTAAVRQEGHPTYQVHPPGVRERYTPVVFLEPFEGRNLRAFGYDMYSEPVRREAMDQALERWDVTVSGKVRLVQETDQDVQAGFLMYLPVQAPGAGRRLQAFVYAPFRMRDLMTGVLGELGRDLDIMIYDGPAATADTLMFDSHPGPSGSTQAPGFRALRQLEVGHHLWTLEVSPLEGFGSGMGHGKATLVLGAGLLSSVLLTALTWSLAHGRDRALDLASARETRFRTFMQLANDSILLVDAQGRILEANDRTTEHFGFPRQTLAQMALEDLSDPADRGAIRRHFQRVLDTGSACFEIVQHRADGVRLDSEVSARRVEFGAGPQVFCIVHDVSGQKLLREEMAQLARQQRAILDSASIGITFVRNRVQVWCNRRMASLCGFDVQEMAGLPTRALYADQEGYDRVGSEAYLAIAQGQVYRTEVQLKRKDASSFWASIQGNAIDPADPSAGSIWTFEDITERRRIQDELALRQGELEELNRSLEARVQDAVGEVRRKDRMLINQGRLAAMGEMIGNIAHQWRQPLNTLSMVLANVRDAQEAGPPEPGTLERSLARGEHVIQRMSDTINDFRNFFRPDKAVCAFSALDQVRAALTLVDVTFEAQGIRVQVEAVAEVRLLGFPNEFSQVVLNLLTNARQAILDTGTQGGLITLRLDTWKGRGRLQVQDNGGGIPEELLERIFEPYFSTRDTGTGIGLYMSKQIIERNMEGRILVRNHQGGAEFTLLVPLAGVPS